MGEECCGVENRNTNYCPDCGRQLNAHDLSSLHRYCVGNIRRMESMAQSMPEKADRYRKAKRKWQLWVDSLVIAMDRQDDE